MRLSAFIICLAKCLRLDSVKNSENLLHFFFLAQTKREKDKSDADITEYAKQKRKKRGKMKNTLQCDGAVPWRRLVEYDDNFSLNHRTVVARYDQQCSFRVV